MAVRAMCGAIAHRGPDDEGFFDSPSAVLGIRRLAIIDVAHGMQPVFNEAGDVVVVFNGEIYNYPDLQRELRGRGHNPSSDGDSACLPHLYEDHGLDFFEHLRGMFAVALWDARRRRAVLGRDPVGKKPLYYHQRGSRLWFASELKALLQISEIPQTLDPVAVDLYLTYQYVPHPHSILRDVHKLPPGHRLVFDDTGLRSERYWSLEYAPSEPRRFGHGRREALRETELADELRERILEATKVRMVSERPLGAFLSGGLDSSAVVAAMARLSDKPVATFSIGFEEEAYNELPHARRVASLYGTEHHELVVTPDIADVLPRVARMFDEPFADASAIPSFYLAEMARQHVVVALTGDGGDESFGGYVRYANFLAAGGKRRYPTPLVRCASAVGSHLATNPPRNRHLARVGRVASRMAASNPADRYAQQMSYFFPWETRKLYNPEFLAEVIGNDPYQRMREPWTETGASDTVNRLLACDVALYLPGDLLPKVDITTMAVSLEARSPLLDQRLVEWAASLPGYLKVRNGTTKYLFKKAMEPWLPRDLIHRKKMGFGMPRDEWLRGPLVPLVHEMLLGPDSQVSTYLYSDEIRALVSRHEGRGSDGARLWALLMLELWHREVLQR